MRVSIVYDSGFGHAAKQAEAVVARVNSVAGAKARLLAVADGESPWDALEESEAIAFGASTYNGAGERARSRSWRSPRGRRGSPRNRAIRSPPASAIPARCMATSSIR